MSIRTIAVRLIAIFAATAFGWGAQMLAFSWIAGGASSADIRFWATYTAGYCVVAAVLVGVPLAQTEPARLTKRPVRSIALGGALGAGIAMVPPSLFLFPLTIPLGALVGALAMWCYVAALHFFPDSLGTMSQD